MFTKALNEDISMHRSTGRVFVAVCLFAGVRLFAPAALAQGEEDSAPPPSDEVAPARAASPGKSSSSEEVAVSTGPSLPPPPSKPDPKSGPPPEAGLPGWILAPPATHVSSGLDWHGNLELDDGYVRYSWDAASFPRLTVYDSRGRFVLGPLLTQDLGNGYFLRETGQVVAWVRETAGSYYQINADDVYVQVGQQGVWDFMAGRFLTWRVFRKGLGFDLYTLEDTGARVVPNFSDPSGFFTHMYEVNTIFMRDGGGVPSPRAAFHLYPTSWSGIELVGSYGRLDSGANALGGRLAGGIKPKYFNLLVGAEYEGWSAPQALAGCNKCGTEKKYGAGGSVALTPLQQIEIAFNYAYGKDENYLATLGGGHTDDTTWSMGGYLQVDPLAFFVPYSLIVGGALFRTEFHDVGGLGMFQRHDQIAAYLAYPLGFNNAVVKLVFSEAIGYQQPPVLPNVDAHMYSVRLRFAYYY